MTILVNRVDVTGAIRAQVEASFDAIQALYRQLHHYSELPFQEHKTSERLAEALEHLGYEVTGSGGNRCRGSAAQWRGAHRDVAW